MVQVSETQIARGAGDLPDDAFRLLVDGAAHPFVLIDRDGTVRYASGSTTDLIGWEPAELVGHNMVEFIPEDQVGVAIEAVNELQTIDPAGSGVPMVFAVARPDGGRVWLEVGAVPYLDRPDLDFIALVLRPWEAQHHLAEFLATLLADPSLSSVLVPLTRSIAAVVQGLGAAVHHGFDGRSFVGATCSWGDDPQLPLDDGPWCDAAIEGETRWCEVTDGTGPPGARGCWLVPLIGDAVAPAVVSVWRSDADEPLIGHRHSLARWTGFVRLALVRTAEHQRLRHLAGHDSLTGVANRESFRARLAEALANGERNIAVAFCDLDGFKPVNDTYGHSTGDEVLVEVAARLRHQLRVGDELARIGGDEFTVLLRNVPDAATANQVANRLLAAAVSPFSVPGGVAVVGMSVGVALAGTGATADGLLSTADAALYACKRAGGGRCAVVG